VSLHAPRRAGGYSPRLPRHHPPMRRIPSRAKEPAMRKSCPYSVLILSAVLFAFAAPARAQVDTGSIVGTVSDESGAALPGATVTATQERTGLTVTVTTNDKGQYVLPNLKVGTYTVAAELQGFRRGVRQEITVHVQERPQVDFRLAVGNRTEEVLVKAES